MMDLWRLVSLNNVEGVKAMLADGSDVNVCDDQGVSALYVACEKGFSEMAGLLLEHGACLSTGPLAPLMAASENGHSDCVRLLLTNRTVVDIVNHVKNQSGQSCFQVACAKRHWSVVELLLDFGAEISEADLIDSSIWKSSSPPVCPALAVKLLRKSLTIRRPVPDDHWLRYALERSTDSSAEPLLLSLLLQEDDGLVMDGSCLTVMLYYSCQHNWCKVVRHLIGRKVDVNARFAGKTPLCVACTNDSEQVADMLLQNGADPNLPSSGGTGKTADVVDVGSVNSRELDSDDSTGQDLYACSSELLTPLCIAVQRGNHQLAGLLLKHGADVNRRDGGGITALHVAMSRVRLSDEATDECLLLLLANKADINVVNDLGETPLYVACNRDLLVTVEAMLEYGRLVDCNVEKSPLVAACRTGNESLVALLIARGAHPDVVVGNDDKRIDLPLCVAADLGHADVVRRLLAAGASVNAINSSGRSALHCVVGKYNKTEFSARHPLIYWDRCATCTKLLLDAGADVDRVDPGTGTRSLPRLFTTLVELEIGHFRGNKTAKVALVDVIEALIAKRAIIENPSDLQSNQAPLVSLDKLVNIGSSDVKWLINLFKAGASFQLLSACCARSSSGTSRATYAGLAQAVVLNGYRPETSDEFMEELRHSESSSIRQFVSWLELDVKRPASLMRLSRVVIRRRLSAASGHRTIVPLLERLALPPLLVQYVGFEGRYSEVDLTPPAPSECEQIWRFC